MKKVVCENCGTKNKANAEFCSKCGKKITEQKISVSKDSENKPKNNYKKIWVIVTISIISTLIIGIVLTFVFSSTRDTTKLEGAWTSDYSKLLVVIDNPDTVSITTTRNSTTTSNTFKIDTKKKKLINKSNSKNILRYKIQNDNLVLIDEDSNSAIFHKINKKESSNLSSNEDTADKNYDYETYSELNIGEYVVGTDIKPGSYKISKVGERSGKITIGNKIFNVTENPIRVNLKAGDEVDVTAGATDNSSADFSVELGASD